MEKTEYILTPEELAMISEIEMTIQNLSQQLQGALRLVMAQQGLVGDWDFDRGAKKLVRRTGGN